MKSFALRRVLTSAAMTVGVVALGATAAAADGTYEVQSGDTLASISRSIDGVSTWQELYAANEDELSDPNLIFPGQRLSLPGSDAAPASSSDDAAGTYTVRAGDTLARIARGVDGVSWQQLAEANSLPNPNLIVVGQVLSLSASQSEAPAPAASSSSGSSSSSSSSNETSSSSSSESSTQTSGSVATSTWDAVAECESNGNWSINTGNGYYGGLQFALSSWEWVGGTGYPHQASKAEQIARAEILLERQGWNAWPACSRALGLR